MFSAPGTPDILSLATLAYQVYDTYKGAPKRFKDLASDVKGLEILLRRLAHRLDFHQDNLEESLLSSDEASGLDELVHLAGTLLEELQQKQGHALAPRGLYRFKWTQGEVDSIRSRITSLCAIIGAFNSSLVLPEMATRVPVVDKQQEILDKLDLFLLTTKKNDDISSAASVCESTTPTLVENEDGDEDYHDWPKLVRRMTEFGITEAEAEQNQVLIRTLAARASSAPSSNSKDSPTAITPKGMIGADLGLGAHKEEIEVLSAVYGPMVVTDTIKHIIDAHAGLNITKITFSINNETFGEDPWPNNTKAFSMIWRKAIRLTYGNLYSAPQKVFAEENELATIDIAVPLPIHESSESRKRGSIYILNASWHNIDVTEHVAMVTANDPRPEIKASNYEFFAINPDPCYGQVKILSVTYTYSDTAAALSHCEVKTVTEESSAQIPPFLEIFCANWGGLDITNLVRANITSHQTLQFDTRNVHVIASPDPLYGHQKTISILYRYGSSEPMQLLVAGEDTGFAVIDPGDTMRRNFFFSDTLELTPNINALAAVWGLLPVSEKDVSQALTVRRKVPCTNEFFKRDGWGGKVKTFQLFLQNGHTGECVCVSAKEGEFLVTPTAWPEE
ncbi:hypothetical protein N7495_003304 [Penicillium taxi]|uniref:uncharacterized protein n=1 Tax=Penicillium taxi TaxID=168475 RepID=UPI002544E729|nr:uncharacterized protein N7495_003304 [Penicillium taxi]KAJ5902776.1 hypothetical protein N7495_003304 [Penicillium taxi]